MMEAEEPVAFKTELPDLDKAEDILPAKFGGFSEFDEFEDDEFEDDLEDNNEGLADDETDPSSQFEFGDDFIIEGNEPDDNLDGE